MRKIQPTASSIQRRGAYKAHRTHCENALRTARNFAKRQALQAKIIAYTAIIDASASKAA